MIPRLVDDGFLKAAIGTLRPREIVDETPQGRMAGIDEDTWRVYTEMYELLTGDVTAIDPAAYEERLRDLTETLSDLHKRGEQGFTAGATRIRHAGDEPSIRDRTGSKEVMAARYPPDGDVRRWIKEGSTGHVDYIPGQEVTWAVVSSPATDRETTYPEGGTV